MEPVQMPSSSKIDGMRKLKYLTCETELMMPRKLKLKAFPENENNLKCL